jgi:hypothetical protein
MLDDLGQFNSGYVGYANIEHNHSHIVLNERHQRLFGICSAQ